MFHDTVFFEAVPMKSVSPFSQNTIGSYGIPTQHGCYCSSNLHQYNNHLSTAAAAALGAAAGSMAMAHQQSFSTGQNMAGQQAFSSGQNMAGQQAFSAGQSIGGQQAFSGQNMAPAGNSNRAQNYNTVTAQNNTQRAASAAATPPMTIPVLKKRIQKGQKAPLPFQPGQQELTLLFGWNTNNPLCDVDVSAFLLGENGKVIGDDWFVFYGQPSSPDNSVTFANVSSTDRQSYRVDFTKLNPNVKKIVFVLTINEALTHQLNFSMMKDAYVRVMNQQEELVSFQMTEYYSNVISMMIGELYLYNGNWKFNAVGNGVDQDLAGLCARYGVQVTD